MVGVTIKYILLFIILFLPSVAAGQLDENTDTTGNTSIIVNDMKVNPIGAGVLMVVSESVNTNIHIIDTKRNDVPDAFIIIVDSMGKQVVKQSDAKGKASAQVSTGMANITIKAGGYEDFNENSVNLSGNTDSTFVLEPRVSPKTTLLYIFALMVPFILVLSVSLLKDTRYNSWYPRTSVAGWIIAFALMIGMASSNNDYNIYFLDPGLKVPLFVPIAAFLGATSHITVSKLDNLERKLSQEQWRYVNVGYGRRILMAPYIAVIALFTITEVAQVGNPWAVLFFAYFVGLYTKQIEGTLKEIGMKFLTEKQKNEIEERDMKALEIVRLLGVSTGIAVRFKAAGIKDINDLIAIRDTEKIAEKVEIDETYLKNFIDKAKNLDKKMQELEEELGIDHQQLTRIVDEGAYSISDLIRNKNSLSEIVKNRSIEVTKLNEFFDKTK